MRVKGIWDNRTPFWKLIILAGIAVASIAILALVATILMKPLFGIDVIADPKALSDVSNPQVIRALKFLQLFNAVGLFVLPPFLFKYLCASTDNEILYIAKTPKLKELVLAGIAIIAAVPLINLLAEVNSALKLPHFLNGLERWMKNSEESKDTITQAFLKADSVSGLLFNLFLIAILPGFGEELLFRGTLQPLFANQTKSMVAGIVISAIIFSALHMQFYGFLPRMAIGVLFGYFLLWTKNLWVSAFAHFLNNSSAVLSAYFFGHDKKLGSIGTTFNDWYLWVLSAVVLAYITSWFYKNKVAN